MFPEFRYIAANVRRLRLKQGLTQEALAERAEMDPSVLARLERAERSLTLITVLKVATALQVKPAVLLKPAQFAKQKPGRPGRANARTSRAE